MRRFIILCTLMTTLLGCDDREEALPSELSSLRIVGLVSSESDLNLGDVFFGSTEPIRVGVIDFHPDDLTEMSAERTYLWEVCFSIGAFARFECLDDNRKITLSGTDPFIDVPTDADTIFGLFPELPKDEAESGMTDEADEEDGKDMPLPDGFSLAKVDMCPEDLGVTCSSTDDCSDGLICSEGNCAATPSILPLPLVVKVTVTTPDGQERQAARSINLRLSGDNNANPSINALKIRGESVALVPMEHSQSPCTQLGPFALGIQEIPFEAIIDEGLLESVEFADGAECVEEDEADQVYLSWYTTRGSLKNEAGSLEYNENVLGDLPDEPGRSRVYVAIRDGRKGISMSCIEFDIQSIP